MKNLLLADDYSVVDDRICPPPTVQPADLGDLLATVAERLESGGVLMLAGAWDRYVEPYAAAGGTQQEPATAHTGDWSARVVADDTYILWSCKQGETVHRIWTMALNHIPAGGKDSPLVDDNPMVTALHMAQWTELTGQPWTGTPGMTGNTLLVDGWRTANPKAPAPRWNGCGVWYPMESRPAWPFGAIEQAYTPAQWERDTDQPTHGYDLNKAYLSAYQVAELPAGQLEHHQVTGDADVFDPKMGGIWRVELSPWTHGHLLPDPAGYAPQLEDGTRWLTTPTLALLQQLTERGDYAGFSVREYWTAPTRRITRKWAELLNDVAGAAREPIAGAAKQVYKQAYGMWARGGRVHRPDWHYTIIALSRANLWRKMDAAYRSGRTGTYRAGAYRQVTSGIRPVRVETDCVFYESTEGGDWSAYAPPGFKLDPSGRALGHFKPYAPKEQQ